MQDSQQTVQVLDRQVQAQLRRVRDFAMRSAVTGGRQQAQVDVGVREFQAQADDLGDLITADTLSGPAAAVASRGMPRMLEALAKHVYLRPDSVAALQARHRLTDALVKTTVDLGARFQLLFDAFVDLQGPLCKVRMLAVWLGLGLEVEIC